MGIAAEKRRRSHYWFGRVVSYIKLRCEGEKGCTFRGLRRVGEAVLAVAVRRARVVDTSLRCILAGPVVYIITTVNIICNKRNYLYSAAEVDQIPLTSRPKPLVIYPPLVPTLVRHHHITSHISMHVSLQHESRTRLVRGSTGTWRTNLHSGKTGRIKTRIFGQVVGWLV